MMHDRVKLIKDMAQQIIDEAEQIDPKVPYWYDLTISMHIPTLTDTDYDMPSIDISYSHYPKCETMKSYLFEEKEEAQNG